MKNFEQHRARKRKYYLENRYYICQKTLNRYIPQVIEKGKIAAGDIVEKLYNDYPFEKYAEPVFKKKASRAGVRESHEWYMECYSAAMWCYLYSINRCALGGYDYVDLYIRKMMGIAIALGLGSSKEFQAICRQNDARPIYLNDERNNIT